MTNTEYNGWTNYETYTVSNWYTAYREDLYELSRTMATDAWNRARATLSLTRSEEACNELADAIKTETRDSKVLISLGRVNYHEIADVWLSDYMNPDEEEGDDFYQPRSQTCQHLAKDLIMPSFGQFECQRCGRPVEV